MQYVIEHAVKIKEGLSYDTNITYRRVFLGKEIYILKAFLRPLRALEGKKKIKSLRKKIND